MTYKVTDAVPIRDTAPSEVEPETVLKPCGCDPVTDQTCAICYRHAPQFTEVDFDAQPFRAFTEHGQPSILNEAANIVAGDRQNDYGTPEENWNRISRIASAMCETPLTAEICIKVLIATKLARMITSPKKRDNYVDLAGYAHVLWEVERNAKEVA